MKFCNSRTFPGQLKDAIAFITLGGNDPDGFPHLSRQICHEVVDQQRYILSSLPKRRDVNGKHVQTIEQVFSEFPFAHHFGKIAVGGCDQPGIHLDGVITSQTLKLALLQNPEQLGL